MNKTPDRYNATKIGDILDAQGRRRDWLAKQVGVSGSTVTRWIKGDLAITRDHAEIVASALGVPFILLFESRKSYLSSQQQDRAAA